MSLEVTTEAREGVTLVTLGGELDIYTVAGFRHDLENVDPAAQPLVIDLTEVTLLDSSGLGALVSLLNRARTEGRADDTEDVIRRRQEVYAEQTEPLIEVYRDRNILIEVDGQGDVDEVTERVFTALAPVEQS